MRGTLKSDIKVSTLTIRYKIGRYKFIRTQTLKSLVNIYPFIAIFLISLVSGCYKFSGDQTIPAYITISGINLTTYFPEEGSNSSDVDNVWVYLNDGLIGVYVFPESDTIPVEFPVLAQGKNKLEIRPGIKLNGITSTRVPYVFYKPIIFDEFDFIPGTTQALGELTTSYYSDTKFAWLEDFEATNISISDFGDTIIERTEPENNPIAFITPTSRFSGEITLTPEKPVYTGISYNSFEMEIPGTITMLELNFKTNNFIQVGVLIRNNDGTIPEKELIILNHTDEWKKIYINLGSNLSLYPLAYDYKVIFRAGLESENEEGKILIDNVKVVYR